MVRHPGRDDDPVALVLKCPVHAGGLQVRTGVVSLTDRGGGNGRTSGGDLASVDQSLNGGHILLGTGGKGGDNF